PDPAPTKSADPLPPVPEVKVTPTPYVEPKTATSEPKVYCTQGGETLRDIARKTLGNAEEWKVLDKLNPDLRAGCIVPAGTLIRLPGGASAAPVGGQAESESLTPTALTKPTTLKPLPIVRMRKPEAVKVRSPMTGTYECIRDKRGLKLPQDACEQFEK